MTATLRKGSRVKWNWAGSTATGKVAERFERRVSRTIEGKRIVRNGTAKDPAFLIEQDDGARVLKRGSELTHA